MNKGTETPLAQIKENEMKNMIIYHPGLSLFLLLLFGSAVPYVVMNDFNNNVEYLSDKCQGKSLEEFVTNELKDRGYTKVSIFKPMIEKVLKENYKDETYWFVDINAKIKMGYITLPKKERLICQCLSEQGFGWVLVEDEQRY